MEKAPSLPLPDSRLFPKDRICAPDRRDSPVVLPVIEELLTRTVAPPTARIPVGPPLTLTLSRRTFVVPPVASAR